MVMINRKFNQDECLINETFRKSGNLKCLNANRRESCFGPSGTDTRPRIRERSPEIAS